MELTWARADKCQCIMGRTYKQERASIVVVYCCCSSHSHTIHPSIHPSIHPCISIFRLDEHSTFIPFRAHWEHSCRKLLGPPTDSSWPSNQMSYCVYLEMDVLPRLTSTRLSTLPPLSRRPSYFYVETMDMPFLHPSRISMQETELSREHQDMEWQPFGSMETISLPCTQSFDKPNSMHSNIRRQCLLKP